MAPELDHLEAAHRLARRWLLRVTGKVLGKVESPVGLWRCATSLEGFHPSSILLRRLDGMI